MRDPMTKGFECGGNTIKKTETKKKTQKKVKKTKKKLQTKKTC